MFFNRLAKIETEQVKSTVSLSEVKAVTITDMGETMQILISFIDDKFPLIISNKNKEETLAVYQNFVTKWNKYTSDIEEFLREA